MKKLLTLVVICAMTILVVACGKKDKATGDIADSSAAKLLAYVPADTPYVFAALEPAPEAFTKKMEPLLEELLPMTKDLLGNTADMLESVSDDEDSAPPALIDFLRSSAGLFEEGFADRFGFDKDTLAVFYGNGLMPVSRILMKDADKFRPALADYAKEIKLDLQSAKAGSLEYDYADFEGAVRLMFAIDEDMLVIAIAPSKLADTDVGTLLGDSKPDASIINAGHLDALASKYEYLNIGLGYIDMQRIAKTVIDGPTGLDQAMLEAVGAPMPQISETCSAEYSSIAGAVPRLTLGYTALDASGMSLLPVMELRSDLATALQPVAGSVPGLTTPGTGLFKMGLALDVKGLRGFVEDKVAAMVDAPYECPELMNLNMAAMQAQQATMQPVPPIVNNFRGFYFDIGDLGDLDFSSPSIPTGADISMLLAFDSVDALVQLGQTFVPQLAQMELSNDGKATLLPTEMMTGSPEQVFAAMSDDLLAIATGDDADDRVETLAALPATDERALMSFSVDLAGYAKAMTDVQQSMLGDIEISDDEDGDAAAAAEYLEKNMEYNKRMQELYGEIFDRETVTLTITENGFELPTTISLH
ncbi:MAG: hypothetical protein AAF270_12215 [Pseudomonadota bacterium]